MSDYASAVERAHRAHAAISEIERELENAPDNSGLQINLLAMRRLAAKAEAYLIDLAREKHVEVCKYRLLPENTAKYLMYYVSGSLREYQDFFSQIYDFKKYNRKKLNVGVSKEVFEESSLEFGYSYSGSLGVVLLAPTVRDFFEGALDSSIDALFELVEMRNPSDVKSMAQYMGNAVIRKARDWSAINVKGGFATDLRWSKSDGRQIGQVINIDRMARIVDIVDQTSETNSETIDVEGILVGGDIKSHTFHFVVSNGPDYRGSLHDGFDPASEMLLGKRYSAKIVQKRTTHLATEKIDTSNELLVLK